MNSVYKILLSTILLLLISSYAFCGDNGDKWFAKDKIQHFAVSAVFAGGSTLIANRHFDFNEDKSMTFGISFSISLGAAKEVADAKFPEETSSVKDFIWDIAGAAAGALVVGLSL